MPEISSYCMDANRACIASLYDAMPSYFSLHDRVNYFCQSFLKAPYQRWCVGEGKGGLFDQRPLYRTDRFDCMSLLNTVMALLQANDLDAFEHWYVRIRYQAGHPHYLSRNYFLETEWLPHNLKQQLVSPVMTDLSRRHNLTVHHAQATIDKAAWLMSHRQDNLFLLKPTSLSTFSSRLDKLHTSADDFSPEANDLSYFSLSELIELLQTGEAFWSQPLVVVIVRPNWDVRYLIGSHLNVSHVGIWVPGKGSGYLYHASSDHEQVERIALLSYLKYCHKHYSDIKGCYLAQIV